MRQLPFQVGANKKSTGQAKQQALDIQKHFEAMVDRSVTVKKDVLPGTPPLPLPGCKVWGCLGCTCRQFTKKWNFSEGREREREEREREREEDGTFLCDRTPSKP